MTLNEKIERYERVLQQIRSITHGESNLMANLANITSVVKVNLDYFWIGFYLVDTESDSLVLGPFQGSPACVRIAYGKGVCGTCWQTGKTQLVPDVHAFPGHIACDPNSRSEIVVPIRNAEGEICMVLDIDHNTVGAFDETDRKHLESLADIVRTLV